MFNYRCSSHTKTYILALIAIGYIFLPLYAAAQVEDATRAADPGRAQREILELKKASPLTPSYEVKEAILQKAPDGAENIKFSLQKINLEGISAYPLELIQDLYADKINTTTSLADIYAISAEITKKYRNDGYILTQVYVPPQTIESGTVTLRVVEGFIDKIILQGDNRESEAVQVKKYAENVKLKGVLNAKTLERNLLLINDLPGVTARTILSPSTTTIGASDMTIIVSRDQSEAELGFDNYGSRYLGAYQGTAKGTLNSFIGHNERISSQVILAGDNERINELALGMLSYEQPISRSGTSLRVQTSYSHTRPGYNLKEFDVRGFSKYLSLNITHPCIRSRDLNLSVRANIDIRNVNSKNNVEETRKDKIRAVRSGMNLQFIDTLIEAAVNAVDIEVAQGIDVLGASDKHNTNLSRDLGEPQFTKANLSLQRLQRITPKINLLLAGEGQLSADPLLSSEEFGVGGMGYGYGRGYDPSEIIGDDGIAGKIELQINKPYEINHVYDYQLFAFLDSGKVWNQDATSSTDKIQSLTSTGFGVRADITEETKAGLAVALPLTRDIGSRGDTDIRILFNLNHEF